MCIMNMWNVIKQTTAIRAIVFLSVVCAYISNKFDLFNIVLMNDKHKHNKKN
jgi:hypothetical protein